MGILDPQKSESWSSILFKNTLWVGSQLAFLMPTSSNSKEDFRAARYPEPPPLSGSEGIKALYKAEAIDGYRQAIELSSANRMARKTLKYVPAVHIVKKQIPPTTAPWPSGQIVWMDSDCDNNLPHTRPPNLICLSKDINPASIDSIVLHERVHVSQRLHSSEWAKIFRDYWSMTQWDGVIPADILLRRRLNPDIIIAPMFIWKKDWVPFAMFKSLTMPDLTDVDIVWWQQSTRTLHRQAPPEWEDFFGPVHSGHEHPFELSAYLIQNSSEDVKAYKAIKDRVAKLPYNSL